MTEYARLETELVKHRGDGRIEIEEFLEKQAEQHTMRLWENYRLMMRG